MDGLRGSLRSFLRPHFLTLSELTSNSRPPTPLSVKIVLYELHSGIRTVVWRRIIAATQVMEQYPGATLHPVKEDMTIAIFQDAAQNQNQPQKKVLPNEVKIVSFTL